ncbi:ABC transporter ATP-binding protein [Acidiphilium sp. AL]|uniref:ABC transporter ATP-binding protein n=1 Tax=Acidiphilium sp. AL TaxID=2871704 RepID=UPI0021CB328D|nr:ABC transporter ATP-binding protein [Acidiphilium sp. AL]
MNFRDAVVIEGIGKRYYTRHNEMIALADVSLTFHEHEFICLLGPSGCGKTTLLNLIAGFEKPTSGVIHAFGRPVVGPGPDRTVVFQEYALFPWLTVSENIQYGLKRLGVPKSKRQDVVSHYIDLIGLSGFAHKYPKQLSGGMRQRVALARALAVNPAVLLMDEPFAALDSFTRERMQDELVRIWQAERKAVVFVTHSIQEAITLADRIIVMSPCPGRVVEVLKIKDCRPRNLDASENIVIARLIRDILHMPTASHNPKISPNSFIEKSPELHIN